MADYDIGEAFSEIEDELISSMIRNLKRHQVEEVTEGIQWSQWQALQLQALEDYKRKAAKKFGAKFSSINDKIEEMLTDTYNTAETAQEQKILKAIQKGIPETVTPITGSGAIQGEFFKTNDRKLDALIKATTNDMERAEHAVLRMTNDQYRKIIFNAQVYANTGAGTYEKAVDMATKDFLSAGINCIQYKNGRRVPIDVYAEMAIRTANKRAYLQGEGEMRKKWGIHTVIMNKRSNPCPKCAPFVGKIIVDDVWSGGTAEEAKEKGYLLMSDCIKQGLYHPNCQDSHTTYFGDIDDEEDEEQEPEEQEQTEEEPKEETPETELEEDEMKQDNLTEEPEYSAEEKRIDSAIPTSKQQITPREQRINEQIYNAEQRQNYCERQVQRFERMSKYSLDKDNQRVYRARKSEWKSKESRLKEYIHKLKNGLANSENNGIIKLTDKLAALRDKIIPATNRTFEEALGISRENSDKLNNIHKSLNDFMKQNKKEKLVVLHLNSGLEDVRVGVQSEVEFDNNLIKILKNSPRNSVVLTHVHPGITPFSKDDIETILSYKSIKALTLECADGTKYIIRRGTKKLSINRLFDIPMFTMNDIYEQVALEKFPDINFEEKWGEIGYPFVTECASRICDHYNLIFERLA